MDDVTPTPFPVPLAPPSRKASGSILDQVDDYRERERRGRESAQALASSMGGEGKPEDLAAALEKFADHILEGKGQAGGGGPSGPGPDDVIKKVKGNTWIIAVLMALFGSGGIVANYYLTEARSKANTEAIELHQAEPMHQDAKQAVDRIERDVKAVGDKVDRAMVGQRALIEGVESLKKEAQTDKQRRLEEKVRELEREKRRLERGGR